MTWREWVVMVVVVALAISLTLTVSVYGGGKVDRFLEQNFQQQTNGSTNAGAKPGQDGRNE